MKKRFIYSFLFTSALWVLIYLGVCFVELGLVSVSFREVRIFLSLSFLSSLVFALIGWGLEK
jgi:hypothetical protein